MIQRIFRVRIWPEKRAAFERDIREISIPYVQKQPGLISESWVDHYSSASEA